MLRSHSGDSITERAVEAYSQIEEPRLREVMAALIRHLHALVKEVRLGEQEWEFAWDFMARMARFTGPERNEFLLLGDVIGISQLISEHRCRLHGHRDMIGNFHDGDDYRLNYDFQLRPGVSTMPKAPIPVRGAHVGRSPQSDRRGAPSRRPSPSRPSRLTAPWQRERAAAAPPRSALAGPLSVPAPCGPNLLDGRTHGRENRDQGVDVIPIFARLAGIRSGDPPGPRKGTSPFATERASSRSIAIARTSPSARTGNGSGSGTPISARSTSAGACRSSWGTGSPSASTPPSGAPARSGSGPVATTNEAGCCWPAPAGVEETAADALRSPAGALGPIASSSERAADSLGRDFPLRCGQG